MRFYQVHRTHSAGESAGYEYFGSLREAQKAAAAWKDAQCEQVATIEVIEIHSSRTGIIAGLNKYAAHPDNG